MVVAYFSATFVHLLLGDCGQRSPRQLQPAHNGLKALEGQRRTVVVHLDYPANDTENMEQVLSVTQWQCAVKMSYYANTHV